MDRIVGVHVVDVHDVTDRDRRRRSEALGLLARGLDRLRARLRPQLGKP